MSDMRWGIVATVDEPTPLVLAFTAYHLGLGASEVHLYFDRPNPEARAILEGLEGVLITECDHAYWARENGGVRAHRTTLRQCVNANHAYERAEVDWLMHCDADEFLHDIEGGIADRLARVAQGCRVVRVLPRERVYLGAPDDALFGGAFRGWAPGYDKWSDDVYGRFAKFLYQGLSGHFVGKSFVRTGQDDLVMNIHFGFLRGTQDVPTPEVLDHGLLHFDGMTPLHFKLKLLRRTLLSYYFTKDNPDGQTRDKQVRFARNNLQNAERLQELVTSIMVLDPKQEAFLEGRGLLHRTSFDPTVMMAKVPIQIDMTASGFDAATRVWAKDLMDELEVSL
ncbi:MAG: glycosyltransferase family 2 protein [Maritimibacter sp.]